MPDIYTRDSLRKSVEAASNGQMTILYDNLGLPNFMSVLPRAAMDELDPTMRTSTGAAGTYLGSGSSTGHYHRAFVNRYNDDSTQSYSDAIYVGQYLSSAAPNMGATNYPVSIPYKAPLTGLTLDQAKAAAALKGPGWHVVTCWENAAFIWSSFKNYGNVRGNDYLGNSYDYNSETTVRLDGKAPGTTVAQAYEAMGYTGGGPATWRHNQDVTGMADLAGNCFQLQDGIRIKNGRIQLRVPDSISETTMADADCYTRLGNNVWGDTTSCGWEYIPVKFNDTAVSSPYPTFDLNGSIELQQVAIPSYAYATTDSNNIGGVDSPTECMMIEGWNEPTLAHGATYLASNWACVMRELAMDAYGAYNVKTNDYPNGRIVVETPSNVTPVVRDIYRGNCTNSFGHGGPFNITIYNHLATPALMTAHVSFRLAYSDPSAYYNS